MCLASIRLYDIVVETQYFASRVLKGVCNLLLLIETQSIASLQQKFKNSIHTKHTAKRLNMNRPA